MLILAALASVACSPSEYLLGGSPDASNGGAGGGGVAPVYPRPLDVSRGGPGSRVIVGDLTGDGRLDLLGVQGDSGFDDGEVPHAVVALTAFELTGEIIWTLGEVDPEGTEGNSEPPAQIYDLDGDGQNEVLTVMNDELLILDGRSGTVEATHALPDPDAHDAIIIANLTGGPRPEDIVLRDRFRRVWAFNRRFELLFTYEGEGGYTVWPHDWDDDGRDELMAGCDYLDHDGTLVWSCCAALEGEALDSVFVGDIDGDPTNGRELVVGGGDTLAYDRTGRQLFAFDSVEAQNLALGDFRHDLVGLETAGLDRVNRTQDDGRDAVFIVDAQGASVFYDERPPGSGWSTILTAFHDWEGEGDDWLVAYRRGPGLLPALLDASGEVALTFGAERSLVFPVDLCGDGRTELLAYTDTVVQIVDHGDCDLAAEVTGTPRPQTKRLYVRTRNLSGEYPYE